MNKTDVFSKIAELAIEHHKKLKYADGLNEYVIAAGCENDPSASIAVSSAYNNVYCTYKTLYDAIEDYLNNDDEK